MEILISRWGEWWEIINSKFFLPNTFLGLKRGAQEFKKARFVVVPVPYDSTVSYRPGTRCGPSAIINASQQVELFDEELERETCDAGVFTLDEIEPNVDSPLKTIERVEGVVEKIFAAKKFPLVLGGEHSITLSTVRAAKKFFSSPTILYFDAHADLRDEWMGSRYSHACTARRILDEGVRVVEVGVRSLSLEEKKFVNSKPKNLKIFFAGENARENAGGLSEVERVKEIARECGKHVIVSIDLDAFDPSIMPAVGTPEPGGLLWGDALTILRGVCEEKTVIGADIVELCPLPTLTAPNFLAARLAYKIIGYAQLRRP